MASLKKLHKKISLLSYQHLDQPQSDSSIENSPYNFVILLQSFTSHSCCYKLQSGKTKHYAKYCCRKKNLNFRIQQENFQLLFPYRKNFQPEEMLKASWDAIYINTYYSCQHWVLALSQSLVQFQFHFYQK